MVRRHRVRLLMNKSGFTKSFAEKLNVDMKKAREIIDTVFDTLTQALLRGERIELRGFGTFVVRKYDSYVGRNPKTGETIRVLSKKLPFFKAGKNLGERVNYGPNILVIDDEESVRNALQETLERLGYTVVTTSSGEQGLNILKEGNVDLIVTDLAMPGLSGWDVAIKAKEIDPHMPVIMTTLMEDDLWMEKIKRFGVDVVMSKPLEREDVGEIIASALELKRKNAQKLC